MNLTNKKLLLSSLLMFLFCFTGSSFAAYTQSRPEATLSQVTGLVEIKKDISWHPAQTGAFIFRGDKIRTSQNGNGELIFQDGTIIHIAKNSYLEILPKTERNNKPVLRLAFNIGKLWAKVIKGHNLDIESSLAVASVKGTEFTAKNNEEEFTLSVITGTVELSNKFGKVAVKAKEKASATRATSPKKEKMSKQEIAAKKDAYKINPQHLLTGKLKTSNLKINSIIPISLNLIKKAANKPDKYLSPEILITSSDKELGVSGRQSDFKKIVTAKLVNGSGTIFAKATKAGSYKITITTETVEPLTILINIQKKNEQKELLEKVRNKTVTPKPQKFINSQQNLKTLTGKLFIDGQEYIIEIVLEKTSE